MSIFNELLPKIKEISNAYTKNFNDDLKAVFECFDKFEEEYQNGRGRAREKGQKDKIPVATLQSIHEVEDESKKSPTSSRKLSNKSAKSVETIDSTSSSESEGKRLSNKRSKNEVDGLLSPEQDKRQKRNASVKAQSIISKQVNVNLTQKLRRDDGNDKQSRGRRRKDDDKENTEPVPVIQIKQEKISLPPEPMDTESLPINIEVKQEVDKDEIAMPPPAAPVPKPRKAAAKDKSDSEDETTTKRRTTRNRKQTDTMPTSAPAASSRSTRASARQTATRQDEAEEMPPPTETRPKRTRAKKKGSEVPATDVDKDTTQTAQANGTASPAEKPRPKRTRRGQKAAERQEAQKQEELLPEPIISPKEERISEQEIASSPILQKDIKSKAKDMKSKIPIPDQSDGKKDPIAEDIESKLTLDVNTANALEETRVLPDQLNATVTLSALDKTVVLPNGVYSHAPVTPKSRNMNDTVVLDTHTRDTMVLDKPQATIMDATVVLDKEPKPINISEDNSLLTDDNSDVHEPETPPKKEIPKAQPTSAVKEKVQKFEELATRVTRTKTRAMAKKEEQNENHTPPDKMMKPVLSAETLNKMNNLIFNGKPPQISTSATKPRAHVPTSTKSHVTASTSKVSSLNKAREAAEESRILKEKEKEDARKKKEALLEAKREQQKKKREEKMAAAAAAREAAERERRAAMEAAARERLEKQAHADQGKLERMKEAERKKQELARKVAETEERRRAEEAARVQRLADEQRRAELARRRQQEEAEATKKEAEIMAKEIEKKQKEYIDKLKKKQSKESNKSHTPLKYPGTPGSHYHVEPVYMADGFQYLNSDEDEEEEPVGRPVPNWSRSKERNIRLLYQTDVDPAIVDKWFAVRIHSIDLREIFPFIERNRLKRTSSAVWRTPPQRLPAVQE